MEEVLQIDVLAVSISSNLGGSERSLMEFARRAESNGISLTVGLPNEGPLATELRQHGVSCRIIDQLVPLLHLSQQPGKFSPLQVIGSIKHFVNAGRAMKNLVGNGLVYSNSFKTHLATALGGVRAVWHVREFPPGKTSLIWGPLAAHLPAGIIANSRSVATAWSDLMAPVTPGAPPVTAVPNGVDTSTFAPTRRTNWLRKRFGIPENAFVFGMPAVFAGWKGHMEVIDAFECMAATHNAHLILVGGPVYDTTAEKQYAEEMEKRLDANPTGRLHSAGFENDIARVYSEFDCTIHYSLRPEPFGRVVIESMSCGTPIIAAAEGGPLEILDATEPGPGTGGWLCKPRDINALQRMMESVCQVDAAELQRIGTDGRYRVEEEYDAEDYATGVSTVLRDLP